MIANSVSAIPATSIPVETKQVICFHYHWGRLQLPVEPPEIHAVALHMTLCDSFGRCSETATAPSTVAVARQYVPLLLGHLIHSGAAARHPKLESWGAREKEVPWQVIVLTAQ